MEGEMNKHFEEGIAHLNASKYEEAVKSFDLFLGAFPEHSRGLFCRALAYRKLYKTEKALEDLDRALVSNPESADVYSERGVTKFHLKDNKGALLDFDEAVRLEPQKAYRYSSRAYIKDKEGDLRGAWQDYNKAVTLDPEDAIARNNLGLVEQKMGANERATLNFKRADELEQFKNRAKEVPGDNSDDGRQDRAAYNVSENAHQEEVYNDSAEAVPDKKTVYKDTFKKLLSSPQEWKAFARFVRSFFKKQE